MKNILFILILCLFSTIIFAEDFTIQIDGKNINEKAIKINENYFVNDSFFDYLSCDKNNYNEFFNTENNLYDICKIIENIGTSYEIKNKNFIVKNKVIETNFNNDIFVIKTLFKTDFEYNIYDKNIVITANINDSCDFSLPKYIKNFKKENSSNKTKWTFGFYNDLAKEKEKIYTNDFSMNFIEKGVLKEGKVQKVELKTQGKNKILITLKNGALCDLNITEKTNGDVTIKVDNGEINDNTIKNKKLSLEIKDKNITFNFGKIYNITNEINNYDKVIVLSPLLDKPLNKVKLCLDPGHGGPSSGAGSHDLWEKSNNYNACVYMKEQLEKEGLTVVLTRELEEDPSLKQRGIIAKENNCDFFVSIHCNSCWGEDVASGYESYYNKDLLKSKYFSFAIHDHITPYLSIPDRKSKSDLILYDTGLGVLNSASAGDIPCTLIEMGFINHKIDREFIKSKYFWKIISDGILEGIKQYISGEPIQVK